MDTSISIYSLLFACMISEILLFCLIIFCKSCKNMGKGELITATMIGFLCFWRILFPIDLRLSYAISFKGIYADLCFIMMKKINFSVMRCELWHGIIVIIGIVALIKIIRFFWEYKTTIDYIRSMEPYPVELLKNVLSKDMLHKKKYDIRMSDGKNIPCGIGIFHRYIMLPCRRYSEDELHYILMHEIQHFEERDLLIKFLTEIICCILWWNPLFRRVQNLISRGIEVRCDARVTRLMSTEEKRQYMMVLVHAAQTENNKKNMQLMTVTSLGDTSVERLRERISILCGKKEKKRIKPKVIAVMSGIVFLLSYCVLPVSQYKAPMNEIEEDGAQYLDLEKCRLVEKNGKYELIDENGEFICAYEEGSDIVQKLQMLIN